MSDNTNYRHHFIESQLTHVLHAIMQATLKLVHSTLQFMGEWVDRKLLQGERRM